MLRVPSFRSLLLLIAAAAIGCGGDALTPGAGTLQITITTTGTNPDPDGYTFQIDGGPAQPIGVSASAQSSELSAGDHTVSLAGMAADCSVSGTNPRTVSIAGGQNATVSFAVTCGPLPPGTSLRWQPVASGTNLDLFGVWGSSATDVFAVGNDNAGTTTILHYDGQAWSEQTRQDGILLGSVWGSGPTNVFAVGYEGAVLHRNGSGWQAMPRPDVQLPALFSSVWGTSATDVFAVGGTTSGSGPEAFIVHYDGTGWSPMNLASYIDRQLRDVAGTSSRDVYAVGFVSPHDEAPPDIPGLIIHYDGAEWTEVTAPGLAGLTLNGVWSSSPSDVFVVGQGLSGGVVLHFDGQTWSPMAVPAISDLQNVWGTSASDVYAVGDGILHYDGRTWTKVSDQSGFDVWGSSPTDVFVVGSGGVILHGTP